MILDYTGTWSIHPCGSVDRMSDILNYCDQNDSEFESYSYLPIYVKRIKINA